VSIEAVIANQIIDASTVGRNALTAADAAAFRATIGANTTYLALSGGTLTGSLSLGENALTCGAITTNSTQLNVSPANTSAEYAVAVGGRVAWRYYGGTNYGNQPLNIMATGGMSLLSTDRVVNWGNARLWNGPSEGILQQRNGLNAQTYELFETYTSSTSFGSLCLKATASGHQIGSALGSAGGSNRAVQLGHFNSGGTFTSGISVATTGVATFAQAPVIASITNTGTITLPTSTTTLVGRDTSDTLTNKRLQRRIVSTTSATSLTPDISAADFYEYTALAAGLTINDPSGTPVNGELLNFRLQDNGTGRAITWGAQFRSMTSTLPTTTVANKTHRILCEWNSGDSTWDCLAVSAQP
jgi:hypothetical protein